MGTLTARDRDHLKRSAFGLPGQRKYPMPDREHAILAKGRAAEEYAKGDLTKEQHDQIIRKANEKLGRSGK